MNFTQADFLSTVGITSEPRYPAMIAHLARYALHVRKQNGPVVLAAPI